MKMKQNVLALGLIGVSVLAVGCNKADEAKVVEVMTSTESKSVEAPMTDFEAVEKLVHDMPANGMEKVRSLYPDLKEVKTLTKEDPMNLSSGMSEESWEYSAKEDVTVVVCKMMNTPAHIFEGKTMTDAEVKEAQMMMKEMMEGMDMDDHADDMAAEKIDLAHYTDYSSSKFDMLNGKQKFVVFFYSDWCGTCRAWEKRVKAAAADLPANTVILKASYDDDKDLVEAWHVKSQSTAVFFNQNGEIVDAQLDPSLEALTSFFGAPNTDNLEVAGEKYEAYTAERYVELKGNQKVAIFFYADWCGTCRAWEKKFMAAMDTLPANTKVLKANYDTDTALKEEFGIKMQSVSAFINADGTLDKTVPDPSMDVLSEFFSS